jgi:hypothetical protein
MSKLKVCHGACHQCGITADRIKKQHAGKKQAEKRKAARYAKMLQVMEKRNEKLRLQRAANGDYEDEDADALMCDPSPSPKLKTTKVEMSPKSKATKVEMQRTLSKHFAPFAFARSGSSTKPMSAGERKHSLNGSGKDEKKRTLTKSGSSLKRNDSGLKKSSSLKKSDSGLSSSKRSSSKSSASALADKPDKPVLLSKLKCGHWECSLCHEQGPECTLCVLLTSGQVPVRSSKTKRAMQLILDILGEDPTAKIVLFSQWTALLDIFEQHLSKQDIAPASDVVTYKGSVPVYPPPPVVDFDEVLVLAKLLLSVSVSVSRWFVGLNACFALVCVFECLFRAGLWV